MLVPDALTVLRTALDQALERDAVWTIEKLKERVIGGSEETELAERCLRWSQRSDIKSAGGAQYFDAYLHRLELSTLESFWGTKKTALEWLLVEVEEKKEQLQKAIALRSTFAIQYTAAPQTSEFKRRETIGRFYPSDGGSMRLQVADTIANEATMQAAEIKVRNYAVSGSRAIIPAGNRYYGYKVAVVKRDNPRGKLPEEDPGGHFYWYYPGTVGIRPDEFIPEIEQGGEDERKQRSDILNMLLGWPEPLAVTLHGLDYDVLSVATLEQRIDLIRRTLNDPFGVGARSKGLIARIIKSVPPADSALFSQRLAEEGLLDQIIQKADPALTALVDHD